MEDKEFTAEGFLEEDTEEDFEEGEETGDDEDEEEEDDGYKSADYPAEFEVVENLSNTSGTSEENGQWALNIISWNETESRFIV